jgi:hypothetical protein
MKYLKIFESFGSFFSPDIITSAEYHSVIRSGNNEQKKFSSSIRNKVLGLPHTKGKFEPEVKWVVYDKSMTIKCWFSHKFENLVLHFRTDFQFIRPKDDEPYVYFVTSFEYKMIRGTYDGDKRNLSFYTHPTGGFIFGRMELDEFNNVLDDNSLWKEFTIEKAVEKDAQTNKLIELN